MQLFLKMPAKDYKRNVQTMPHVEMKILAGRKRMLYVLF